VSGKKYGLPASVFKVLATEERPHIVVAARHEPCLYYTVTKENAHNLTEPGIGGKITESGTAYSGPFILLI
jgi:hypothetical protein